MKTIHLNTAGPARREQLAHGRIWPARSERKGSAAAWQGLRPTAALAQLGRSKGNTPAPRLCGGAARPAAGGHLRPRQGELASARDVRGEGECGRVARRGRRGEGRRLPWRPSTAAPWPSVARRGEAHPGLGRRSKLERDLKEGEAKLRARAIGEWRGGAGARRRRSCGRGEGGAWGSRLGRRGKQRGRE